jgi:hypothetical protein
MKRLVALFIGFFAGAMTVVCSTYGQKNDSPLMVPYTPTRLEWLALDLESRYKSQFEGGDKISSFDFTAIAPDTILISVVYTNDAPAAFVDKIIDEGKHFVEMDAQSYGWSKWVRIRVERRNLGL